MPEGRSPIDSKWVFDIKRDVKGEIRKYKARAVARGFCAVAHIDFFDTFSSVACYPTTGAFLTVAAEKDWGIEQVDITTAFLNAPLEEEVYVCSPPGAPGAETGQVWLLKKAVYGLK